MVTDAPMNEFKYLFLNGFCFEAIGKEKFVERIVVIGTFCHKLEELKELSLISNVKEEDLKISETYMD